MTPSCRIFTKTSENVSFNNVVLWCKYEVICIIGDDPNNPVYAYMSPESANWVSDDSPDVYQDWLVYKNETAFFKHTGKGLLPNRLDFFEDDHYAGGNHWDWYQEESGTELDDYDLNTGDLVFNPLRIGQRAHRFGGYMYKLGICATLGMAKWKCTKKVWNSTVEPYIIDAIDNIFVWGLHRFIEGMRSDNE